MPSLLVIKGPMVGQRFTLKPGANIIGRERNSQIALDAMAVSRKHARIQWNDKAGVIEDIGSANGTFINGELVRKATELADGDRVQIGPYHFVFQLHAEPSSKAEETDLSIREEISVTPANQALYNKDAGRKLQAVLTISQNLARTLDLKALLDRLLENLFTLFPQTDRGLVLLCENDQLVLHAQRSRRKEESATYPYSRTVVRRVLKEGVGVLSEDVPSDARFQKIGTLAGLHLRSLLCVPLIGTEGGRLGVLQLDSARPGNYFGVEELQLLTAVALQVSTTLENAMLHAELLREEELRHELAMARQIQQQFLLAEFPVPEKHGFELHARVRPAREVSGDLYDFFFRADGRLVFLVGDVSGKGIPAALFMLAVRTLVRHPETADKTPAEALRLLNVALSADNRSGIFVTLVYGVYEPKTGELVISSCAHPEPFVRRVQGTVEKVPIDSGSPLGMGQLGIDPKNYQTSLEPGELLALYTDGITEMRSPDGWSQFSGARLQQVLAGSPGVTTAAACAVNLQNALDEFNQQTELQDDQTLLLLRRLV